MIYPKMTLVLRMAAATLAFWSLASFAAEDVQPLVFERAIALPGVTGRIDHMDLDVQGARLFIAALGSDAVEVIDLAAGKRVAELRPFRKPQGVRFVPSVGRLFVANGDGGGVVALTDGAAPLIGGVASLEDADNLRFHSSTGTLVAGFGEALALIDPASLRRLRTIPLAGHPEAFSIENSGRRIFVNVPTAGHVAVVDLETGKVSATWALGPASENFPMTLDEAGRRLFVATRRPAMLVVFDITDGRRVAELPMCGDADDLFFDASRKQLYAVCGQGVVDVFRQGDADHYVGIARIPTGVGARTGLFWPDRSTLYVAVPSRDGRQAEIRVYKVMAGAKP